MLLLRLRFTLETEWLYRILLVNPGGGSPCSQRKFLQFEIGLSKFGRADPAPWEKWAKGAIHLRSHPLVDVAAWTGLPKNFPPGSNRVPEISWVWFLAGYGMIHYAALVWRDLSLAELPPHAADHRMELPTVSVIIPAYNEGLLSARRSDSVTRSHYPCHKRVIAVDDGSTDDTWEHICTAASRLRFKVTTIRQQRNPGKRFALYAGQKATGKSGHG
jgi:hypothetical protein